jgi:hypothetical protein
VKIQYIQRVFLYWVFVMNEQWYVRFVLIAGHSFCLCSWLVTMCDIWLVFCVSSMMNATCEQNLVSHLLMLWKLKHGKIERIWYLQISKTWQVVECAYLDWCNLIRSQITTKYEIRIKYNDNLRPNKQRSMLSQWCFLYSTILCDAIMKWKFKPWCRDVQWK